MSSAGPCEASTDGGLPLLASVAGPAARWPADPIRERWRTRTALVCFSAARAAARSRHCR